MLVVFNVADMNCGHCASAITRAIKEVDKDAQVLIDVGGRTVEIEPGAADPSVLQGAISAAGYTPIQA